MIRINPKYQPLLHTQQLTTGEAFLRRFVPPDKPPKPRVLVKPVSIAQNSSPPLEAFFKVYDYQPASWGFLLRPSKARCEFQNYEVFERLHIPCAERIACGEQRTILGRLRRAFILTRTIPQAMTLIEFFESLAASPKQNWHRELRTAVLDQLALLTRSLHQHHFFHHDLVWRNILITQSTAAPPQLWCIDCPRGRFDYGSPWRDRRRLRDLASVDKSAALYCSRTERLRLMKSYLGQSRLNREVKERIGQVLHYRRTRWPAPSV